MAVHRSRSAGRLRVEDRILERRVDRRLLDAHAPPIGVELFRDELRDGRVHALPHLGEPDDDGDAIIGCDAQVGIRLELRCGGLGEALRARQGEADDESTGLEEIAA